MKECELIAVEEVTHLGSKTSNQISSSKFSSSLDLKVSNRPFLSRLKPLFQSKAKCDGLFLDLTECIVIVGQVVQSWVKITQG